MANKFKTGDLVDYEDGTPCRIDRVLTGGMTYSVLSLDYKRAFFADESKLFGKGSGGGGGNVVIPGTTVVGTTIYDSTTEGLTGIPPDSLGNDHDIYIDSLAGVIRRKSNGTWS